MVSFKNESIQERIESRKRKQAFSLEVIVIFLILVAIVGTFGVMKFWQNNLNKEIANVDLDISKVNSDIEKLLSGGNADFYKRSEIMSEKIYQKHSSPAILTEIEKLVVPRVVLLSFVHTVDKTDGETINITADADEYYLMAQQIKKFKESSFFSEVRASDTSRNSVGRIVFTIKARVSDNDSLLYFSNDSSDYESSSNQDTNSEQDINFNGEGM